MEKAYRFGMVEEVLADMDMSDVADDVIESEEDYKIIISGLWVHIPELKLNLYEGIFCNYDEKEQEYLPDFSITVIKEENAEDTKEGDWIYYEQDGFVITLAKYLHGEMDIQKLEQLPCVVHIPSNNE